tara:strand:+ start:1125 stop:1712 length:588 start_codon:yes stop_codon:yes gene_type:complete
MKINKLRNKENQIINGPLEIKPKIFNDDRGYFYETWNAKDFEANINSGTSFVQDNQSFSERGTLRGLHYQLNPMSQGKLVRVTKGKVFDVIVDLRQKSKTFKSWTSLILNCQDKNQMWIPKGFAHGFLTLSKEAILEYKVTNFWEKDLERTILWDDSLISIEWPRLNNKLLEPNLSSKDMNGLSLQSVIEKGEVF